MKKASTVYTTKFAVPKRTQGTIFSPGHPSKPHRNISAIQPGIATALGALAGNPSSSKNKSSVITKPIETDRCSSKPVKNCGLSTNSNSQQ
jgi:hypothetical protein